jgi:serine/threonine protein phosphatase 1
MRLLAVGDIHGCYKAFETLLNAIEIQPADTLVTLGDYVDRGPASRQVIERLLQLKSECHLVPLLGNHEQMMLEARESRDMRKIWLGFGGAEAVEAYGSFEAIPDAHWRFLEKDCLPYWEADTHFFVHANADPDRRLYAQSENMLRWEIFDHALPHESGKIMVCGHTSQKNGLPCNKGFAVCIDTYAHGGGWMTCLEVNSGTIWQANQAGQVRQFALSDLPIYG